MRSKIAILTLGMSLVAGPSLQALAQTAVGNSEQTEAQARVSVTSALTEVTQLQQRLQNVKFDKNAELTLGITTGTLALVGSVLTLGYGQVTSDVGNNRPILHRMLAGDAALAAVSGYGFVKWYKIKNSEIPQLESQLAAARKVLESDNRLMQDQALQN